MKKLFAVAASAVASLFVLAPVTAQATDPLPTVHPGMSITMNGGPTNLPEGSTCTVTAVGHDDQGRLLGLAAGHCIPPSEAPEVYASDSPFGIEGNGPHIGNWITKPTGFPGIYLNQPQNLAYDGAFFEILPGVPVSNQLPNGTRINRLATSGPNWLQHFCKFGQTTQETCGWITKTGPSPFEGTPPVMPGDSGGPAYNAPAPNWPNAALMGITSAQFPTRFADIDNVLADAALDGVTGFTPLP